MPHEHTRRKKTQKYLRENCHHRIKCTAATFLSAFMWRRPLNSTTLATTTHRKPKRVSDGTGTQVKAQMINKYRMKMVQRDIYNVKDPPWKGDWKNKEKHYSNLNYLCIHLWLIYTRRTSSDGEVIQLYLLYSCSIIFQTHTSRCQIH